MALLCYLCQGLYIVCFFLCSDSDFGSFQVVCMLLCRDSTWASYDLHFLCCIPVSCTLTLVSSPHSARLFYCSFGTTDKLFQCLLYFVSSCLSCLPQLTEQLFSSHVLPLFQIEHNTQAIQQTTASSSMTTSLASSAQTQECTLSLYDIFGLFKINLLYLFPLGSEFKSPIF